MTLPSRAAVEAAPQPSTKAKSEAWQVFCAVHAMRTSSSVNTPEDAHVYWPLISGSLWPAPEAQALMDALNAAYRIDFPGGAPQAGDDVQTSRRKESSGAKDLRADAPTGRPLAGDSECAVLKPCGLVETDDAASPASVRGEISEEEIRKQVDYALGCAYNYGVAVIQNDPVTGTYKRMMDEAGASLRAILRESRKETR